MSDLTGVEGVIYPPAMRDGTFRRGLERLINEFSRENGSNTPDFILATYMARCLDAFDEATRDRELWYGRAN